MKKYWYAVQRDPEDDWGSGSFDLDEAKEMARELGEETALIAVIDGDYDDGGNATADPICIEEIYLADF